MSKPSIHQIEIMSHGFQLVRLTGDGNGGVWSMEFRRPTSMGFDVRLKWSADTQRYTISRDIPTERDKVLFEGFLYIDKDLQYILSLLDLSKNYNYASVIQKRKLDENGNN